MSMPEASAAGFMHVGENTGLVAKLACITIWDFTGRKDSSGNQRESATLFPQGLSLYSRRAVPKTVFPQGLPFIPAGLAQQPRAAFSSCPACADGDGRDPCRQACGPARR